MSKNYSIFKISKLKNEEDFKEAIKAQNQGTLTYYKCKQFVEKQKYYIDHKLRKNGVIAIWIHFELMLEDGSIDGKSWQQEVKNWVNGRLGAGRQITILYENLNKTRFGFSFDMVYTAINEQGKVDLTNITHNPAKDWLINYQKSYFNQMSSIFSLEQAPKDVCKAFYKASDYEAIQRDGQLPRPMDKEPIVDYYERVKAYDERKKREFKDKEETLKEKCKDYKLIKGENKFLAKKLKQCEKIEEIAKYYPDLRTLKSYISDGQKLRAAYEYYKNEGYVDVCKYIEKLLKNGRKILVSEQEE